jgi:hypothetical protein
MTHVLVVDDEQNLLDLDLGMAQIWASLAQGEDKALA